MHSCHLLLQERSVISNFSDKERNALVMLTQNNVPYTLGIPGSSPAGTLSLTGISPSAFFNPCYNQSMCKNLTAQTEELNTLKQNTSTTGILMSQVRYDLNTLRSLSEDQYTYAEVDTVPAPLVLITGKV